MPVSALSRDVTGRAPACGLDGAAENAVSAMYLSLGARRRSHLSEEAVEKALALMHLGGIAERMEAGDRGEEYMDLARLIGCLDRSVRRQWGDECADGSPLPALVTHVSENGDAARYLRGVVPRLVSIVPARLRTRPQHCAPRPRARRPAARRAAGLRSGQDPGDEDPEPEPPDHRPRLYVVDPPRPPLPWKLACLSAEERGADVEAVVS